MPRLTPRDYLSHRQFLIQEWSDRDRAAFGGLPLQHQLDLHDYCAPSATFTDREALTHREEMAKAFPSLPQKAGRPRIPGSERWSRGYSESHRRRLSRRDERYCNGERKATEHSSSGCCQPSDRPLSTVASSAKPGQVRCRRKAIRRGKGEDQPTALTVTLDAVLSPSSRHRSDAVPGRPHDATAGISSPTPPWLLRLRIRGPSPLPAPGQRPVFARPRSVLVAGRSPYASRDRSRRGVSPGRH